MIVSTLYRNRFLADCDVVLIDENQPEPQHENPPQGSRVEVSHRIVLADRSACFNTKIRTSIGAACDEEASGKKTLFVQLEPELWDPFVDHLLYHMYHDALPKGLDHQRVLQLMALADRFQVPACLTSCNDHFKAASSDDLSWDDVSAFYSMPDTLREGVLKEAGSVFAARLRASFECLEEAWRDEGLRATFLQLPLGAVEALAAMDELQVVSENTVALVLASWLAAHEGREAAAPALLGLLRLHHLTHNYLGSVLPKLPGLGKALTVQHMADAARYAMAPAELLKSTYFPDFKPARKKPSSTELTFEWRVRMADIAQLIRQSLVPEPQDLYGPRSSKWQYNGFTLQLTIYTFTTRRSRTRYIKIALDLTAEPAEGFCIKAPGSLHVEGSVRLPSGPRDGQLKAYPLWVSQLDEGRNVVAFKLSEDVVHDAASFMAALATGEIHVRDPGMPPARPALAAAHELVLSCTVSECY